MAAGAKKIRVDAWGEGLAEDVRWSIFGMTQAPREGEERPWLRTFDDAGKWLSANGYDLPSRAGWYRFLERMREREAARRVLSVETSKRIARGIQKVQVDKKLAADMFTGLSVDAASSGNDEAAKMLADAAAKYAAADLAEKKLELDRAAQATKEEQLRLAREKFEAAEKRLAAAADTVRDDALTPEQQVAKMKEIFGIHG